MGKLIVFEGTDGSGKSTQFDLLTKRLEQEDRAFRRLRFPRYDKESSALIRMYLGGQFGSDPNAVNAYAASTFYAVDRYASYLQDWKNDYEKGMLFLADRYTTSNAVHQGGKMAPEERAAYYDWLYGLEFGKMGLPKPDLVILMDMPIELTRQLMRKRESATNTQADIHEQDLEYLAHCRESALEAAKHYGWTVISGAKDGQLRSIEEIHAEVYTVVEQCLKEQCD